MKKIKEALNAFIPPKVSENVALTPHGGGKRNGSIKRGWLRSLKKGDCFPVEALRQVAAYQSMANASGMKISYRVQPDKTFLVWVKVPYSGQ